MRRTATHVAWQDRLATVVVAAGALVYVLWSFGVGSQDVRGVRVVTTIVLVLGFAASASAVVPGFDELIHGSKLYLALASLLGLAAFVAGIAALVTGSEATLGALVATTVALWAISTIRHAAASPGASAWPAALASGRSRDDLGSGRPGVGGRGRPTPTNQ
jgi:hypothetical protein